MFLSSICAPALIYIGFSLIQIFIDIYNNSINDAFLKFIFMLVFTLIINILCDLGFVVIAWIIVFIPIIMMTIISTLLLQVFGLDPKNKQISSQTNNARDISSNNLELTGTELLNQQKYAYYYDQHEKEKRIDRDELRYKAYDKIDTLYSLPFDGDSSYDLSKNPLKFFIVDKLLNYFDEYSFVKQINNSELYHTLFSDNLIHNNSLYNEYIALRSRPSNPSNLSALSVSVSDKPTNHSIGTSYNEFYKLNGYDLFKRNKYQSVKSELTKTNPNVTSIQIDAKIEDMWNKLSETEKNAWNTSKDAMRNSEYALKYNHKDLTSYGTNRTTNVVSSLNKYADNRQCPVNETPLTYKTKTGLTCYEICPPGKIRNASGYCR
jgi:hypothetical protein